METANETLNPKVIVMMLCYNHGKYVGQAIESVLKQTYTHLELHIINDGSADNSAEVIRLYAEDSRVVYHELHANTNSFGAKRLYLECVASSVAKYVANLDSDDMWKPDKLEKQVALLEKKPHFKACFTWDEIIREQSAGEWRLPENYSEMTNRSRYAWFYFFFQWGNRLNACSMLMDRLVFMELGGFDPNYRTLGVFMDAFGD